MEAVVLKEGTDEPRKNSHDRASSVSVMFSPSVTADTEENGSYGSQLQFCEMWLTCGYNTQTHHALFYQALNVS